MEEQKNIFDYLGQVFMLFGITIAILNVFCLLFGESAKGISSMFALGNQGLRVWTMAQYLLSSAVIVFWRHLFFTDWLIKNLSVRARAVGMILTVLFTMGIFITVFHWFPIGMWQTWTAFFICFGFSFIISLWVSDRTEKAKNRKLAEALKRLKEKEGEK